MTEALSAYKYVFFFLALIIGVPIGYNYALRRPMFEKIVFFLAIFFTARMEDINFFSREWMRLTSKGFEIGMVDLATMILILLIIKRSHIHKLLIPPGTILYALYLFSSILSMQNASDPLYSWFEIWKMLRMYVYFWTMYNYVRDKVTLNLFLRCVAAITLYVFYEVIRQKYINHQFQVAGPFPHQNSLVMYMIIFGSIIFAYLLNNDEHSRSKTMIWITIFGMAAISIISTLSRAGMVLFALSIVIVLFMSFNAGYSHKKLLITLILALFSMFILLRAWDSITERFETAPEASANTRIDLAIAAQKMANDERMGIGLNNFGVKINPPYNYSSHIPMHDEEDPDEKNGLVETIYLMIAAECGWHTLVFFFLFIFYFYFLNLRNYIRYRGRPYQFLSIAFLGGLIAIYLESVLEWVLKQTNNFYQLMLVFAIIAIMYRMDKETSRKRI